MSYSRQIKAAIAIAALLVLSTLTFGGAPANAATESTSTSDVVVHTNVPVLKAVHYVTVVSGNTLSRIARVQCHKASMWPTIWHDNRAKIKNPNLIYPGQRFIVNCAVQSTVYKPVTTTRTTTAGWVNPIRAGLHAISCWGAPRVGHTHKGVDLLAASGTRIRAAHAGTVVEIKYDAGGAGWYVALSHPGKLWTVYMHMRSRTFLHIGSHVSAGQTIGYVGQTGDASGPHLHFEVHSGRLWHQINPAPFMRSHGVNVGC